MHKIQHKKEVQNSLFFLQRPNCVNVLNTVCWAKKVVVVYQIVLLPSEHKQYDFCREKHSLQVLLHFYENLRISRNANFSPGITSTNKTAQFKSN